MSANGTTMKPSRLPIGDAGTAAGVTTKAAYVPPSRRNAVTGATTPPPPEKVDLDNASAFPTLVSTAGSKKAWAPANGGSGSFSEKIHEWIAFDRMTAVEKARAAEKARELEGWETLVIKKMPDLAIEFNTNLLMAEHFAKSIDGLNGLGLYFPATRSFYRSHDDGDDTPMYEEPAPPNYVENSLSEDEEENN
jgi:hypothetical protein